MRDDNSVLSGSQRALDREELAADAGRCLAVFEEESKIGEGLIQYRLDY